MNTNLLTTLWSLRTVKYHFFRTENSQRNFYSLRPWHDLEEEKMTTDMTRTLRLRRN